MGCYNLVELLLEMNASVEDRGGKGDCTPLMEASMNGFAGIVKLLLRHGANTNTQSASRNTALHYACARGDCEIVSLLLDHSSDIELQNEKGHTPLLEAVTHCHLNVALILIERGAQINTCSCGFKDNASTPAYYEGK